MIRKLEQGDTEGAHWLEIREERVSSRRRWSIRAAQWRALELAREVFGDAAARLEGFPPRGAFEGMVHLSVPFQDLETHSHLEARFSGLAGRDELLSRVPLVFVFEPRPEAAAREAS
jgi:hypothetical protein